MLTSDTTLILAVFGAFLVTATAFGDGHELISDSFDARGRVPLAGRLPDTGPTGTAWMVEDGAWTVRAGSAFDDTKVNEYFSGDRRAVVETRTSDMFVSAVIERKGGSEFQGVVARCAGPIDWTMAFYDGVGDLVLGAEKSFRRLRGHALLPKVAEGAPFRDGIEVPKVSRGCAA